MEGFLGQRWGVNHLRRCQELVFDSEGVDKKQAAANLFEAVELVALAYVVKDLEERLPHGRLGTGGLQALGIRGIDGLLEDVARPGSESDGVNAKDGHEAGLLGVAVHVRRRDQSSAAGVHILNPLGGDVLALGKLENVLLAIDNLDTAEAVNLGNVTGVEPAVSLKSLLGLLLVLVVFAEDARTPKEKLAAGARLIVYRVLEVGNRLQANLDTGGRGSDGSESEVLAELESRNGVGFGETVALAKRVSKRGTQELVHVGVQHGAAAEHGVAPLEAERSADLGGPDAVVENVGVGSGARRLLHVGLLGLDHVAGESTLDALGLDCGSSQSRVELVEQARHGHEGGGVEELHVVDKPGNVSVEITNAGADSEGGHIDQPAVDVGEGEV